MVRTRGILICISISLLVLLQACAAYTDGREPIRERYVLDGSVVDNRTMEGLENFTVVVNKEGFTSRSARTDRNGSYDFVLPPGNFTLRVMRPDGMQIGYRTLEVGPHLTNHWDFEVDPEDPAGSVLKGSVIDDLGRPLEGALVAITMSEPDWSTSARTDGDGEFLISAPPGEYRMTVLVDGREEVNRTLRLDWDSTEVVNIEVDLSDDRPILKGAYDLVSSHWLDILLLVGSCLIIILVYGLFLGISSQIRRRRKELFDSEWFIPVRKFIGRAVILGLAMVILRQISIMSDTIDDLIWSWMPGVGAAVLGMIFVLMAMRILLHADEILFDYIRRKKGSKGDVIMPPQVLSLLEIISRYLIMGTGAALIVLLVLSAAGLGDEIIENGGSFLSDKAGELIFLLVLVVVAVLVRKFIDIFFTEVGSRSAKLSPQVMDMSKKGVTGMVYFIITLIFIFTLLSISGLGEIGQSFILVISMIVGLVVSFAATGSIGNMLSGLVIISMKPFDVGDRVEISNGLIGNIENMGIMFTRIRDLEGRVMEIPNNNVLQSNITNFSSSAKDGDFAVYVDVSLGYDIPPRRARSLMKRAAVTSPGVLKEPTPTVMARSFQDHAVEYRLRAYTNDPQNMLFIRSSVMESMINIFHQEGLEILSPLHHVKREGKCPDEQELQERTRTVKEAEEEDASGLTMFDGIGSQ